MPPLNFLPTLHPANFHEKKREDIFKLEALFQYFAIFIGLYIISRIVYYFTNSDEEDWVSIIIIPITLLLVTLIFMIATLMRIRRLQVTKNQTKHYIYYFDAMKALISGVLTIIVMEFKLLDKKFQSLESTPLFWLSAELALITWPTILSLQTKILNIFVLAFHFLYLYIRFEGFQIEVLEASFWLAKIIPLIFYTYKLKINEKSKENDKSKQKEERKFASKVLNILPEGVAIVDETGLQYMNDSMRTIMRVKDDQCLETLYFLENIQYYDDSNNSGLHRKSATSSHELTKKNDLALKRGDSRSPIFARFGHPIFKFSEKENLKDISTGGNYSVKRLTKRSTNSLIPKKVSDKIILPKAKSLNYKYEESEIKNDIRLVQDIKESNSIDKRDGYEEEFSERRESVHESIFFFISISKYLGLPRSLKLREERSSLSLANVTNIKLRIKRILNRIEEPYQKSNHKTVKQAIDDILGKMREEFASETVNGVIVTLFPNVDEKLNNLKNKRKSRSLTFSNKEKKQLDQSLAPNHWAMIMQSTRKTPSGIQQYLEVKFTPIISKGRPAIILLVRDVTEKEIIKQMEEKERSQSRVLASVSHEFRTPLNGIMGMLENLKEEISHDLRQTYLMPAYNSAKLLLTLVNDILDFHQIKEKKFILIPVRFNLRKKIEESLSLISTQAKARGLNLKVDFDSQMPKYICNDPNRVQQVVNNLLGNAIKFTLEGSITIRVEPYSENKIVIRVIDTGIGIEPVNIEKLFTAFGKVDSKVNRELNPQGVGLGLTISNSLAKVLCSEKSISGLNVTSQVKKGTTFWFVIDDLNYEIDLFELDDEDDDIKNLNQNVEDVMRKFNIFKDNIASNSVFHFATTATSLKDTHSPGYKGQILPSSMGSSVQDSPTKGDFQIDLEKEKKSANMMRKNVLKRNNATYDNLGKIFQKIKEKSGFIPAILLADDDEINHMVFRNYLSHFEVEVHSAYNGKQALQKIQKRREIGETQQFILVFLDVEMPVMNGIQCAKELKVLIDKGEIQSIPIIGQSGHGGEEEILQCKEAGMSDYLQKPIAKAKLMEHLAKWLKKEDG